MGRIILISLIAASSVRLSCAQSVQGSCVGSINPDGSVNRGDCGGSAPPTSAPARSSFNPVQQAQMQGAQDVGAAIGTAFVNWLVKPAPSSNGANVEQQRQQQLMWQQQQLIEQQRRQQQAEAQRRQQEAAQAKFEQDRDQLLDDLKNPDVAPAQTLTGLKSQALAMDCAVTEVYKTASSLGPEGRKFADGLRAQVLNAKKSLPKDVSNNASNTCDIVEFSRDSMADDGIHGSAQLVVQARVTRLRDTGETQLTLLYSLSAGAKKTKEGQDVIVLNSYGGVDCQQATPAAAKCLAGFNPKSAATDYCPKPPPERTPPYPACDSAPAPAASDRNGADELPLK